MFLRAFAWLARPILLFYALPWLMLLLTLGTVAQRSIGLYASQKLFFDSWILWVRFLPLPGGKLTLCLIALATAAKLALHTPLTFRGLGVALTHGSILLLLLGGSWSALWRKEGTMTLFPHRATRQLFDDSAKTLLVTRKGTFLALFPEALLHQGHSLALPNGVSPLKVEHYCNPCFSALENESAQLALSWRGRAFRLDAEGREATFLQGGDRYGFSLVPLLETLPFSVTLTRFEKEDYPGSDKAKRYASSVHVQDEHLGFDAFITMNHPLYYRDYIFYQSSFAGEPPDYASILTVVRTSGRAVPYLALGLFCAGLALHLCTRRRA
jgi:hypothetical protein